MLYLQLEQYYNWFSCLLNHSHESSLEAFKCFHRTEGDKGKQRGNVDRGNKGESGNDMFISEPIDEDDS